MFEQDLIDDFSHLIKGSSKRLTQLLYEKSLCPVAQSFDVQKENLTNLLGKFNAGKNVNVIQQD